MVAHNMLARRRDLSQHAGDVLEGVDAFGLRRAGIVATGLRVVQHLGLAGQQPQPSVTGGHIM